MLGLGTLAKLTGAVSEAGPSPLGSALMRSEDISPITSKLQTPTPNAPATIGLASKLVETLHGRSKMRAVMTRRQLLHPQSAADHLPRKISKETRRRLFVTFDC